MRKRAFFCLLLALMLLLSACGKDGSAKDGASAEFAVTDVDLSHYADTADNARVFYEIFVGSFSDSDGDGVGDLRGIINRFDYLNDGDPASGRSLGVEGLWLTPPTTSTTCRTIMPWTLPSAPWRI